MARYVLTATDTLGGELGQRVSATAPTLAEIAEHGDLYDACFVTVRRGSKTTLYERSYDGSWAVIETDVDAGFVAEAILWRGAASAPAGEVRCVLTATDAEGHVFGHRLSTMREDPRDAIGEVAEFGELHETNFVLANVGEEVVLYGRETDGSWTVITAEVDAETAAEVCLWFDLTHHYQGRSPIGSDPAGRSGHLLDEVPPPATGVRMDAARAISLVVEHIRSTDPAYPVQGLEAARFDAGWRVYAPMEVDESDPMAFLAMPVDQSVFLVSDLGRIKETTTSIPPRKAEELFAAQETYVRRRPAWAQTAADPVPQGLSKAKADRLLIPIAQQLALLAPERWERFTAVFSFTVSAEFTRLEFSRDGRTRAVPVPERMALLVRRQRHLAAYMGPGAWWRLLIVVTDDADNDFEIVTSYDYARMPFPDGQLLPAEHYRTDIAAYPRPHTSLTRSPGPDLPAWLTEYLAGRDLATAAPSRRNPPRLLDISIDQRHLHTDPEMIAHGSRAIALHEADWVRHWITPPFSRHRLAIPRRERTWNFEVHGGLGISVAVEFTTHGNDANSGYWSSLVDWSKRYLEPRLVAKLAAQARNGETVEVSGLWVHARGFDTQGIQLSLAWQAITGVQIVDGNVCIYQVGKVKPAITVPLKLPNAVLLPQLIATLKS